MTPPPSPSHAPKPSQPRPPSPTTQVGAPHPGDDTGLPARPARPLSAALVGAPTDVGAGARGCSMGPEALRVAGIATALERHGLVVHDRGNLAGPTNPWQPPTDGHRHLDEVIAWNRVVYDAVLAELRAGHMPVFLGGDHSLAIGSISAVARACRDLGRPLRILWLDAHADFNTSDLTPSGNLHGMPVACLSGHGPDALTGLAGFRPAIAMGTIQQVGIRSIDAGEKRLVHEQHIAIHDMRRIDEIGMRRVMVDALSDLEPNEHLHVSFDIDFLDPDIAPGVGTAVRGGPTYREAQLCMEMIADTGHLGSIDVMELNPAFDVRNRTAELAVDLLESLVGKSVIGRF
ncbi:MAG: arginase [Lautropia sp.]